MTESMRERVMKNMEMAKSFGKEMTIEGCKEILAQKQKSLSYWTGLTDCYLNQVQIDQVKGDIEYYEAVIEVLTEQAAAEAVTETVQVLAAIVTVANKAKAVRRAVATLANKLHKLNFSLSESFRKAWSFIKGFTGLLPSLT